MCATWKTELLGPRKRGPFFSPPLRHHIAQRCKNTHSSRHQSNAMGAAALLPWQVHVVQRTRQLERCLGPSFNIHIAGSLISKFTYEPIVNNVKTSRHKPAFFCQIFGSSQIKYTTMTIDSSLRHPPSLLCDPTFFL